MLKLPINCQLILWNKQIVSDETLVTEFQTTIDSPILLLNSESTKIRATIPANAIKFPEMSKTPTNCDSDAQLAKVCASMAYSVQRTVDKCVLNHKLANNTPTYVILGL